MALQKALHHQVIHVNQLLVLLSFQFLLFYWFTSVEQSKTETEARQESKQVVR